MSVRYGYPDRWLEYEQVETRDYPGISYVLGHHPALGWVVTEIRLQRLTHRTYENEKAARDGLRGLRWQHADRKERQEMRQEVADKRAANKKAKAEKIALDEGLTRYGDRPDFGAY